jgi:hypothetical protein
LSSFFCAARHYLEGVVRQRPLQSPGFVPRHAHPDLARFVGRQDDWHGFRVYRLDDHVWRRGQEAVDVMWPGNRFRFGAAVAAVFGPDPGDSTLFEKGLYPLVWPPFAGRADSDNGPVIAVDEPMRGYVIVDVKKLKFGGR